jgi:hypothetical protein
MLKSIMKAVACMMLLLFGAVIGGGSILAALFCTPLAIIGLPMGFAIMALSLKLA